MRSLTRAVLLASALGSINLVNAQTIEQDGKVIAADESTVAPAGELVVSTDPDSFQLTDTALANLTELDLTSVSLFKFPGDIAERSIAKCKTFPGDALWPSKAIWKVFNLVTGGALIETVPIGAVCYEDNEHYDSAKCEEILAHWTESATHVRDPTSVMSPLYQGETCMPQNGNTSTCELGGFPSYSVKATTIAQVQLAINFARNLNIRLVVHNTGHDFLGKSTGAGSLSIWTHNLKQIRFIESYTSPSYTGAALKIGAGVQVGELYAAADKYGVTAVGGECKGVGVSGGYTALGGHSPLSTKYGMGSDQVLSIDVVTPNGRFLTVDEKNNKDLFWALRGGGGSTFGVVTAMTVKAHPKMPFSGVTFTILSGPDTSLPVETFWSIMDVYWRKFPAFAAKGTYGYSTLFSRGPNAGYMWSMLPWLVPGMALAEFKEMVSPLFAEWAALGLEFEPKYFEHDNFYETWSSHFPTEGVANINLRTASRLIPKANWEDESLLNDTLSTIRGIIEEGSALIAYNINGAAPAGTPESAVNPAWREALMFGIFGAVWAANATTAEIEEANRRLTEDWMGRLRVLTPGGGAYGNEGDVMEPDFAAAFYGANYERLLEVKGEVDPWDVFWAPTAVGSERWFVEGQEEWLTLQTGRLCRAV
ncbi:hypothetical protein FQN51_007802 [Onygenales sp. PD_10]|nr:hypothetical protein FQN51_007802 [Onygenales sp. PD_10]